MSQTCPACGARQSDGYTRCALCGLTHENAARDELIAEEPPAEQDDRGVVDAAESTTGGRIFCTSCGAESPAQARFCWQCGEKLVVAAGEPARPPETPAVMPDDAGVSPAGKYAFMLVGGAAAVVVLLFLITQFSGRVDPLTPPPEPAAVDVPAAVLPENVSAQVALLEERIAASDSGAERFELRQELVQVLVNAGAFARAGEVQEAVAREEQTVDAWAEAGSFYLAHVLRQPGADQPTYARRAAQAFEEALELRPDDLDIMTDLATAYRYHPENPMRAVELVQHVLEADPDHARARFNYALMLAEIGRNDQAREQLEAVVAITDVDPFVRDRAWEMLETML